MDGASGVINPRRPRDPVAGQELCAVEGGRVKLPPRLVHIELEVQACVTPAALVVKERAGARSLTHALERFFVDRLAVP